MTAQDLILALHGASVIEQRADCLIVKIPLRLDGCLPPIDRPPFGTLPDDEFTLSPPEPEAPAMGGREWFETVFWPLAWRKDCKAAARASAIRKAKTPEIRARIIAGVKAQAPAMLEREKQFRPLMATWLNQERWEDPVETDVPVLRPKSKQEQIADDIRKEYGVKE